MTSRTTRRRWAGLAMATLAAMILQPAAQATPQLADLKVKQSMSVQAGTQVSLTGKTLTAIPLASYTAANVTDGKMVGYDLTTIPALRDAIASAAKDIGATQKDLNVNGTLDPMVWVVRTLTDANTHPWGGRLRDFCDSLAKQDAFKQQQGTKFTQLNAAGDAISTGAVLTPGIYAVVDRTPATVEQQSESASIMMMNGTGVSGADQLITADGSTVELGQVIYKLSEVETPDKRVKEGDAWKEGTAEAIGKNLTYRITQKIPNWTGYEHYYLALNDTFGKGIDYAGLQSITVDGKSLPTDFYHETIASNTVSWLFGDAQGDVLVSDASKQALPVGATIVVTYTARLNGDAAIAPQCNPNSISLEYSHNPNSWNDHNDVPGNEVNVCTGAVNLKKVDSDGKDLSGAEFTIAEGANGGDPLKLIRIDDGTYRLATDKDEAKLTTTTILAGNVSIRGLNGEYTISEKKAPEGFSSLMLPSAVINVHVNQQQGTYGVEVKSDSNKLIKLDGTQTVTVTNVRSIVQMPLTGAAGLTAILLLAAALLSGGLTLLRITRESADR